MRNLTFATHLMRRVAFFVSPAADLFLARDFETFVEAATTDRKKEPRRAKGANELAALYLSASEASRYVVLLVQERVVPHIFYPLVQLYLLTVCMSKYLCNEASREILDYGRLRY